MFRPDSFEIEGLGRDLALRLFRLTVVLVLSVKRALLSVKRALIQRQTSPIAGIHQHQKRPSVETKETGLP